jgi:ubiquinone/menaquinone biosynthesis C-methylase UbiE
MRPLLSIPHLITKALYYRIMAGNKNLPAKNFENFGRKIGLKNKSLHLFLNPISSVRYFEFDFCYRNFIDKTPTNILDISSPFLFSLYMSNEKNTNYFYLNPDRKDLQLITKITNGLNNLSLFKILSADASKLPFEDNKFDMIVSISVIEHIDDSIEAEALKEMWRILNKGGTLLLTFPSSKQYYEEYRDSNVYDLKVKRENQEYFFQRFYDDNAIQERILKNLINHSVQAKEIYGEIHPQFYSEYVKRWQERELKETIKDPYYMVKEFKKISSLNDLTGNIAITCLSIRKN